MDGQSSNLGKAQPVNRFLVFAVYFMGALIILLFLGLIGGIICRVKNRVVVPEGTGLVVLGLPTSSQVREAILTGDKPRLDYGHGSFHRRGEHAEGFVAGEGDFSLTLCTLYTAPI